MSERGRVTWKPLHPKMTFEHLGYIPMWLHYEDLRSARDQVATSRPRSRK